MTVVALIDGLLPATTPALRAARSFCTLHPEAARSPAARHAAQMAAAILQNAPRMRIDSYVIFPGALACSINEVCAAFDHAADSDAEILHCSFGLPRDVPVMAAAVARALRNGKRIVASAPARGAAVYPAAYSGVISVQGDARCTADTWSWLGLPNALFGACAVGTDPAIRGASTAAAHFTGHLAQAMSEGRSDQMQAMAAYQGRERIGAERAAADVRL